MRRIFVTAAVVLLPAAALAQARPAADSTARPAPAPRTGTAAATEGAATTPPETPMTPAMRAAQNNPRIIGSPAWWLLHATADGQLRQAGASAAPAPAPAAIPAPTTPAPTTPPGGQPGSPAAR